MQQRLHAGLPNGVGVQCEFSQAVVLVQRLRKVGSAGITDLVVTKIELNQLEMQPRECACSARVAL